MVANSGGVLSAAAFPANNAGRLNTMKIVWDLILGQILLDRAFSRPLEKDKHSGRYLCHVLSTLKGVVPVRSGCG